MKISAPTLRDTTILEDRAASCFGTAGQSFMIRARAGITGSLVLNEESLVFSHSTTGDVTEIPIHEIHRLGMGRWHEGTASFVPVLKITYRNNLILAVQVAHPEKWIEAIEALALDRKLPLLNRDRPQTLSSLRYSRFVIVGVLILALLSTILPAFFTWVHRTTVRDQGIQSEPTPPPVQESAG